jgi:hypothetical protein
MRITIAHKKTKAQAIQAVDRAVNDILGASGTAPITIANPQKSWNGSVLAFSLTAKMGILQNPISGTVEVTDTDVTVDADVGMLGKLFSADKLRTTVESRIRGLLS